MKLIETHGASIPALGFGTYTLTGEQCSDMVSRAIDAGYRHIDTAYMYENEKDVGEGIRRNAVDRSDLFVATKVWWTDIAPEKLIESAKRSVDDLGVGAVDLLMIHWPNPDVALEASIDALNRTVEESLARHIGVCNFPSALFNEANAVSARPLVCNQVEYHPLLTQNSVLEAVRAADAMLTSYSPIGRGGELLGEGPIRDAAEAHGKSPAQIVLAWHMAQENVAAIPRTSNPDRLVENIDIFDFEFTAEQFEAISALRSPGGRMVDPDFAPVWDRD